MIEEWIGERLIEEVCGYGWDEKSHRTMWEKWRKFGCRNVKKKRVKKRERRE
jgi:hypothetical protein